MNALLAMVPRNCPVCGAPPGQGKVYFERAINPAQLNDFSFASRKVPEFMCYRMVQCSRCAVVFAAEAPEAQSIYRAYDEAAFDSTAEALAAAQTYCAALQPYLQALPDRRAVLEIGTGTGVFLEQLSVLGFQTLVGIEPSHSAIAAASAQARPWIRHGIFHGSDFADQSFSLICCFMTLEHVPDPLELVKQCHRLLAPRGQLALVVHNYNAPVNRILGKRSPIVDIEHLQLFHPESLSYLLRTQGFSDIEVVSLKNRYRAAYWLRLLPLPERLKHSLLGMAAKLHCSDAILSLNAGNILGVATKAGPAEICT